MLTIVTSLMGTVAALITIYNFTVPQARDKYQQWKYERHIEENGVIVLTAEGWDKEWDRW